MEGGGGAIAKIKISVESDTVKHLKAFRIIEIPTREMPISLLTLMLIFYFWLHIQKIFYLVELQIFVSKVYRSVVLKNTSLRTVYIIFILKCFYILIQKY